MIYKMWKWFLFKIFFIFFIQNSYAMIDELYCGHEDCYKSKISFIVIKFYLIYNYE